MRRAEKVRWRGNERKNREMKTKGAGAAGEGASSRDSVGGR